MKQIKIEDFSLKHTLESGQFFLYEQISDFYYIIHTNRVFKVKQEGDTLFYHNINENELRDFFNLDLNLKDATKDFDDKHLILALEKYWGLRLLNQDLWQCVIGFICSQCSNIPKIKLSLKMICEFFGKPVYYDDILFHTFPKIGDINDLDKLKLAKTGYRAQYIYEINKVFLETDFIDKLKEKDYVEAKKMLMTLLGIGSKVADCICLYGLGLEEAFPIDTWIKQVLESLYYEGDKKSIKELERFINDYFKSNRGLKQQYLFHYARNNLKYDKKPKT